MSPASVSPVLKTVDLSCCPILEYVLIESSSLENLSFARCVALKKVLLQARRLKQLDLKDTSQLDCLMLWSDALEELRFYCKEISQLELYCPKLVRVAQRPATKQVKSPVYPIHPSVLDIVRVDKGAAKVREYKIAYVKEEYRPYVASPVLPRSPYLGF